MAPMLFVNMFLIRYYYCETIRKSLIIIEFGKWSANFDIFSKKQSWHFQTFFTAFHSSDEEQVGTVSEHKPWRIILYINQFLTFFDLYWFSDLIVLTTVIKYLEINLSIHFSWKPIIICKFEVSELTFYPCDHTANVLLRYFTVYLP